MRWFNNLGPVGQRPYPPTPRDAARQAGDPYPPTHSTGLHPYPTGPLTQSQACSCHRVGILTGLDNVGACSLPILRTLMDYEAVK